MSSARVLDLYFKTEMTRDLEAILGLFAEDAVFQTPDALRKGRDEIRPFYEDAARRFPQLSVSLTRAFTVGSFEIGEWSALMTDPEGRQVPLEGVNIARVDAQSSTIQEMRSYYDVSSYSHP
jgi:uncharacterized protein (TIGR02246 family)